MRFTTWCLNAENTKNRVQEQRSDNNLCMNRHVPAFYKKNETAKPKAKHLNEEHCCAQHIEFISPVDIIVINQIFQNTHIPTDFAYNANRKSRVPFHSRFLLHSLFLTTKWYYTTMPSAVQQHRCLLCAI